MLPLVKLFRYSNVNVSGQVRSHPPDTRRTGRQMTVFYQKTVALFRAEPDSGSLPVFGRCASVAGSRVELTCAETRRPCDIFTRPGCSHDLSFNSSAAPSQHAIEDFGVTSGALPDRMLGRQ